jgi:hypothetical protein
MHTKIRTTTRQVRPHTNSVIHPTTVRVPPTRRLAVRSQPNVKHIPVIIPLNQILRLATKTYRQLRRMRRLNDLLVRRTAHEPRREQERRKLGLTVTWGHVYDQTLQLTVRHTLQLVRNDPVMLAGDELRPDVLHKRQKIRLRLLAHLDLRQTELKLQQPLMTIFLQHRHL